MKIVVLPGLDGTGALLGPFCDALPAKMVAQAMRYPADLCAYDDIADWLGPRLPCDDYMIVAESFSGPLALQLTDDPPDGLRGIVFVATFATSPRWIPRPVLRMGRRWPFGTAALAWLSLPMVLGRWGSWALGCDFAKALRDVPVTTLIDRLDAVRTVDARNMAPTVPTLYVRAGNDWLVPRHAALHFADVVDLDGPHFLLQANPKQAAEVVGKFVDKISLEMREVAQ